MLICIEPSLNYMITSRARAGQGAVAVIIQAGLGVKELVMAIVTMRMHVPVCPTAAVRQMRC